MCAKLGDGDIDMQLLEEIQLNLAVINESFDILYEDDYLGYVIKDRGFGITAHIPNFLQTGVQLDRDVTVKFSKELTDTEFKEVSDGLKKLSKNQTDLTKAIVNKLKSVLSPDEIAFLNIPKLKFDLWWIRVKSTKIEFDINISSRTTKTIKTQVITNRKFKITKTIIKI